MPTVRSLSLSTISAYVQCSQKVWYSKIEMRPTHGISAGALTGSALHAACESWYRALALGRELNAETLFKVFCIRYEREPQDQITYGSKDRDSIYATARKLLELLVHQVERPHKIVAIERSISYALTPDLTIVGRPDLIARDASGRLVLTDVKSTARSYGPDDIRRVTEQCWFYALAMDEAITLRCLLLLKKKTPEIQEIRLSPDDVDYDEMVQKAVGVKASIEAGIHFRVRSWACAGCGFRQFCDAKDGELAESYNQRRAA